ncbi:MAG: hypothetical protein WBK67_03555 [Minisyncoccales bacterium]|jgi:hypothetical protein
METFLKSDIFFFITGASVIILTFFWLILTSIIAYFSYKILKNIKSISATINNQVEKIAIGADKIRDDANEVRREAKTSVLMIFKLFNSIIENIIKPKKGRKPKK